MQIVYSTLIQELHKYAKNHQFQRAVIGLSGGLDSAVALCIAVRAFGAKNVHALILPEVGITPNDDTEHARALADHFGCPKYYQPINNFLVDYNFVPWDKSEEANQSLKPRVRSALIKHFAESQNALFIGTANKSDLYLGYGELAGEFSGDLHILGDLYKSEIAKLAEFIGLPEALLHKAPSRHTRPHQSDEGDLSGPWNKIDEIIRHLGQGTDPDHLIEKGMDSLMVHKIVRLLQQHEGLTAHLKVIAIGQIRDAIKRAQEAEASSMN